MIDNALSDQNSTESLTRSRPRKSTWPDPVMNFLVAYDIAQPKRLKRVASCLELVARRVQKSVFLFTGTRRELDRVIAGLVQEIKISEDRIQAWPIRTSSRSHRIDAGAALPETGVAAVISPENWLVIEAVDDPKLNSQEPLFIQ